MPDEMTRGLRRQVARRNQIVRHRVRLKTMTQSILHAHLLPRCPHADLFGSRGRSWLVGQPLPADERDAVERHLREYDRLGEDLRAIERELAQAALANSDIKRLMTIPGIDMVVALGLAAAIGPIVRFNRPDQLVAYLGLNPSVYQSGDGPPQHGRITKQGRNHARSMLVEAAWQAVRGPGPPRGFYERVARRRGTHVAAVAVARKIAVIVWHMLTKTQDYAGVRPALHSKKLRELELRAGQPERRGKRGTAYAYNLSRVRQEERRRAEQSEIAYRRLTEGWTGLSPHARFFAARSSVSRRRLLPDPTTGLFNLIRVTRATNPGWQHGGAVMGCHLLVGTVDARLVGQAAVTPARRLSQTSSFGAPPRKASALTWAPIQSASSSLQRASA